MIDLKTFSISKARTSLDYSRYDNPNEDGKVDAERKLFTYLSAFS